MNPYWPWQLSDTVNFTYNGKEVWDTIMKFGNGFVTMITEKGYRNYSWNKLTPIVVYQCAVSELIKLYQWDNDQRFKYLYDFYGPYEQTYPWKMD